jgi:hypothetical protein
VVNGAEDEVNYAETFLVDSPSEILKCMNRNGFLYGKIVLAYLLVRFTKCY